MYILVFEYHTVMILSGSDSVAIPNNLNAGLSLVYRLHMCALLRLFEGMHGRPDMHALDRAVAFLGDLASFAHVVF